MKDYKKIFFTGILTILPISITIFILEFIYNFLDSISAPLIKVVVGFDIPGVGFLITVSVVFIVGLITNNIAGKKLVEYFDNMMHKVPVINIIYNSVKELSNGISQSGSGKFSQVVMVNFPGNDAKSIGFITKESLKFSGENKTAVFVPTTPNPTSGFLMFFDPEDVVTMDLSVDEAVKIIVSMGVVTPAKLH